MNIVQVNLFEDVTKKRYTYKVPDGVALKKGYIVKVRNTDGREVPAKCVSDSEDLSSNAIEMIMCGSAVKCSVIGVYSYVDFGLINAVNSKINT